MKRDCSTVCNSWSTCDGVESVLIRSPHELVLHGGHLNTKAWYLVESWFPKFEASFVTRAWFGGAWLQSSSQPRICQVLHSAPWGRLACGAHKKDLSKRQAVPDSTVLLALLG